MPPHAEDLSSYYERDMPEMKFPLTIGFNLFGNATDLSDILEICQAVRLNAKGTWRSVIVPAAEVTKFLKILDCCQTVEDIHGLTAQGRVPLKDYLGSHGIPLNIPV